LSFSEAEAKIAELEHSLVDAKDTIDDRDTQILKLTSTHESTISEAEAGNQEKLSAVQAELRELQSKWEDSEELVKSLKSVIDDKTTAEDQTGQTLAAKSAEWQLTETRLKKLVAEAEEEKRDLTSLVDQLRLAGQVWHSLPTTFGELTDQPECRKPLRCTRNA
jgi:CAP-Gly domain-containing linker protein 1